VVFSTATPVANTMAEIHTMMRYLQPRRLEELGLQQFDAWAATFGESVTALEIAPDGSGYRMHTRFARFINVPELMAVFGEVADIRTAEMLKLPVPRLRGDKPRIVACPASTALKAFVQTLVQRAEAIRSGHVKPQDDNMLAITTDGRKAALDFRLVAAAGEVRRERQGGRLPARGAGDPGAQHRIPRCAAGVLRHVVAQGGHAFSVYDDLQARLIEAGVPEKEIAFVHDAETDTQKATLFKAVREGRVRVLLGSTAKMGIGTNVQTRLCALHHLDAPWRPCDVEQREGRILRQGNECEDVEIFRYVTEGSFDSYMWQTLETKARFIAQVMKGDKGIRSLEDVELAALSYAEVKALASGNPLVIEKAGVDAEVARLSTLFSVWRNQRYANESEVSRLPMMIEAQQRKVALYAEDVARIEPQTLQGICLEVGGRRSRALTRWARPCAGSSRRPGMNCARAAVRLSRSSAASAASSWACRPRGATRCQTCTCRARACMRRRRTRPARPSLQRWSICWRRFQSSTRAGRPNAWRSGASGWTTSGSNSSARSSTRPTAGPADPAARVAQAARPGQGRGSAAPEWTAAATRWRWYSNSWSWPCPLSAVTGFVGRGKGSDIEPHSLSEALAPAQSASKPIWPS
jgi:hypothetical protein